MTDLVAIVGKLHERGIQFRSLTEPFDTTTAGGEMFFHICAAFAQMNGRIISERTVAGLAAAKARGRRGGRPSVMTAESIAVAQRMRAEKATWESIGTVLRVGASTVRRTLSDAPSPDATTLELRRRTIRGEITTDGAITAGTELIDSQKL